MVFALETYCPAKDGYSAARIEEEVVVTDTGLSRDHAVSGRGVADRGALLSAAAIARAAPVPSPFGRGNGCSLRVELGRMKRFGAQQRAEDAPAFILLSLTGTIIHLCLEAATAGGPDARSLRDKEHSSLSIL
jgi:hypothetical protein